MLSDLGIVWDWISAFVVDKFFPTCKGLLPDNVLCGLILSGLLLLGVLLYVFPQIWLLYPDVRSFYAIKVLIPVGLFIREGITGNTMDKHTVNLMRMILPVLCGYLIKWLFVGSTPHTTHIPKKKKNTPQKNNASRDYCDLLTLYHDIGTACQPRNIALVSVLCFIYMCLPGMNTLWRCIVIVCIVVARIVKYYRSRTPCPEKNPSQQRPASNDHYWISNVPVFLVVMTFATGGLIVELSNRWDILLKDWTNDNLKTFLIVLFRIIQIVNMTKPLLIMRRPIVIQPITKIITKIITKPITHWLRPSQERTT